MKESPDYQNMNIGDIFTLKKGIKDISIDSTTLITEDITGNYMENLFNFVLVKGDDYKSSLLGSNEVLLPNYLILIRFWLP